MGQTYTLTEWRALSTSQRASLLKDEIRHQWFAAIAGDAQDPAAKMLVLITQFDELVFRDALTLLDQDDPTLRNCIDYIVTPHFGIESFLPNGVWVRSYVPSRTLGVIARARLNQVANEGEN